MANEPKQKQNLISMSAAASLLMIGEERVRQLVKAGYITRPERGMVTLISAVQGYIKFLRDEDRSSTKTAAESRLRDARSQEVELRIAEKRRELVPVEDAIASMDFVAAAIRSEMLSLPASITRDIDLRRKIEQKIHDALNRTTEKMHTSASTLRAGGELFEAVTTDDA